MTGGRYHRQIPLIGAEGQERLADATVSIIGAGGLGSPVSTYLALAGVGELIIIDDDEISPSNLNRQFLHASADIGKKKACSAWRTLHALNPDVTITALPCRVTSGTVSACIHDADIIVDASDNYETRFLLNRAALSGRIPLVHGAVSGCSGQMTTIIPGKTPCLSCIIPHPSSAGQTPIIGAAAGVIGSLQALEVIKYLTGAGNLIAGRLLIWDGMTGKTDFFQISARKDCPECGHLR